MWGIGLFAEPGNSQRASYGLNCTGALQARAEGIEALGTKFSVRLAYF